MLIDTGAQVSLVVRGVCGMSDIRPSPVRVTGITGKRVWNHGEKTIVFRAMQCKYELEMQVVDNLGGFDGILGSDFLDKYRAVIDVYRRRLRAGSQDWPLNEFPKEEGFEREERAQISPVCGVKVRLTRVERVPPRCEKLIRVPLPSGNLLCGREVIAEPELKDMDEFAIARGLCRVDSDNHIVVQVANFGSADVVLRKGTLLSTLEEVDGLGESGSLRSRIGCVRANKDRGESLNFREKLCHLNDTEVDVLMPVLEEYAELFCPSETPPATNITSHQIHTGNAPPIYQRPYRTPHHQKPLIEKFVKEQLEAGIITPSESPWASPVVIVPKKSIDGKPDFRFCVDFRRLNAITTADVYPLPNIVDTLDHLGGCNYFTTLDLTSGYHQIPMHPESQPKTGFIVESGLYEYKRLPFGLRNAPSSFQRMMDSVLRGLKPTQCLVYLDDVIIFSKGIEQHAERLKRVFDKLREANLSLKFKKCHFALSEVKYLGHVITRKGIKADPDKIEAVKTFPSPNTTKELQSFLGLSNYYRRFIHQYADMARPLTKLLRKGVAFTWTPDCQEAMDKLKEALTSSPVLTYPDFKRPFVLSTDASNFAVGAVLSQVIDGEEHPIAFASRQLNTAETNYSTTEKELLGVVFGVTHFKCYLIGAKFKIVTDHAALKWLFSEKDPSSRLLRWTLKLGEYNYEVTYKPGKKTSEC